MIKMDETGILHAYMGANRAGAVMVDVGGHFGGSSRPFLESGWRVYAFEPDSANRTALQRLAAEYPALAIDPRAVSKKSKKGAAFYRSDVSSGISGLHAFHPSHVAGDSVDVVSLRDFFVEQCISRVDFLKIDTEGHDLFVLQGFPWEKCRPDFIECEFEDRKTESLGYKTEDMARFLIDKGYYVLVSEWKPIVEYGRQHTWHGFKRWPCELECAGAWGNLLAFREPPDWERFMTAALREMDKHSVPRLAPKPSAGGDQGDAIRAYLKTRWRCLRAEGTARVYVFGGGKFTRWFLRHVQDNPGPSVMAVLDEAAKGGEAIEEIPVVRPADVSLRDTDVIVLGTDTSRDVFAARCRELFGNGAVLVDLFDTFSGPVPMFEKELHFP